MRKIIAAWVSIRIMAVGLLLINVFWGFVINILIDCVDGDILFGLGLNRDKYEQIDKMLDFWLYIWLLVYAYVFWLKDGVWWWLVWWFGVRLVGEIVYAITKKEESIFWFPNIFTSIFAMQTLFPGFLRQNLGRLMVVFVAIALTKEYVLHVRKFPVGETLLRIFRLSK